MNINVKMVLTSLVAKVPLYIEGRPGVGKTATIQTVAEWLGRPLVTIVGATRDRTDFGGWPRYSEKEDRVRVYPFPWVEELVQAGDRGILFLDEINASEEVFPVLLRVITEKVIGDTRFEGDVIAAGNPEELSVAGLTLPAPVANRVLHYHWKVLPEEWADGMVLGFASIMGSPPPTLTHTFSYPPLFYPPPFFVPPSPRPPPFSLPPLFLPPYLPSRPPPVSKRGGFFGQYF